MTKTTKKSALITGITGQDGSYLAELLLKKGYKVSGIVRKTSHQYFENILGIQSHLNLMQADLLDHVALEEAIQTSKPDEIYNLASQSHPKESFRQPIYTAEITAIGAHRIFEIVRRVNPSIRLYQASSSEMFGWVREIPQNETTPFNPANPYAASKLYAHNIAQYYRQGYGMFVSCGILFNHESPRRHMSFVTQKIAYGAACVKLGIKNSDQLNEEGEPIVNKGRIGIGNLEAKRDWGYAGDYVASMWMMLQQKKSDNYVIGTGETHTIRELCEEAFSYVGLDWKDHVFVDKRFVRPTETGPLVADYAKATKELGWKPKIMFKELIHMMVDAHIEKLGNKYKNKI